MQTIGNTEISALTRLYITCSRVFKISNNKKLAISIIIIYVSSVVVGATVSHGKFYTGKVVELSGEYVTVGFEQGEKRFLFTNTLES